MASPSKKSDAIVGDETFRWAVKLEAPTGVGGAYETVDVTDTDNVLVTADIDTKAGETAGSFTVTREAGGIIVFDAPTETLQAHGDTVFWYDARIRVVDLDVTILWRHGAQLRLVAARTVPA